LTRSDSEGHFQQAMNEERCDTHIATGVPLFAQNGFIYIQLFFEGCEFLGMGFFIERYSF
jgi:hypothetical protein